MLNIADVPPIQQPPSLPGQLDLFRALKLKYVPKESMLPEGARLFRKCNRCGDRNPVVYDGELSPRGCPVCCCPEYTILYEENHEMVTAVPKAPSKSKVNKSVKGKAAASTPDLTTSTDPAPPRSTVPVDAAITDAQVMGELLEIELELIQPSPDNPREHFDDVELTELSDSIMTLGILQPLLVGRCGGIFELIAGERRYRASRLAGKSAIPCYVRDMTPEEVTLARWAENKKRVDLSVIEEARSYLAAMKRHGWTQAQVAATEGLSPGEIANRLRLLKLPEDWQKRIISREMHKRQGLDLVQFAGLPTFFESLDKQWKELQDGDDDDRDEAPRPAKITDLSAHSWERLITAAVCDSSRRLKDSVDVEKYTWRYVDLSGQPAEVIEKLECREVTYDDRRERRCFNLPLWTEIATKLAKEEIRKEEKKNAKKDGKAKDEKKPEKNRTLTAEELKKRAEQHNKRLYRHRIACLQKMICDAADTLTEAQIQMFLLTMCVSGGSHHSRRMQRLRDSSQKLGAKLPGRGHETEVVGAVNRHVLRETLIGFLRAWTLDPAKSWSTDADPIWIEWLASDMKIDFAKHWRVSPEFLALHSIEQLVALGAEWKLNLQVQGREQMIKQLMLANTRNQLPVPKELANVTPCQLD